MGGAAKFAISFDEITVPDDLVKGVWSGTYTATMTYSETEYAAVATDLDVTIEPEEKFTVVMFDICLNESESTGLPSGVSAITLTGTWSANADGGYTFGVAAGNTSGHTRDGVTALTGAVETLELTADAMGDEILIKISFGMACEYEVLGSVLAAWKSR